MSLNSKNTLFKKVNSAKTEPKIVTGCREGPKEEL